MGPSKMIQTFPREPLMGPAILNPACWFYFRFLGLAGPRGPGGPQEKLGPAALGRLGNPRPPLVGLSGQISLDRQVDREETTGRWAARTAFCPDHRVFPVAPFPRPGGGELYCFPFTGPGRPKGALGFQTP